MTLEDFANYLNTLDESFVYGEITLQELFEWQDKLCYHYSYR